MPNIDLNNLPSRKPISFEIPFSSLPSRRSPRVPIPPVDSEGLLPGMLKLTGGPLKPIAEKTEEFARSGGEDVKEGLKNIFQALFSGKLFVQTDEGSRQVELPEGEKRGIMNILEQLGMGATGVIGGVGLATTAPATGPIAAALEPAVQKGSENLPPAWKTAIGSFLGKAKEFLGISGAKQLEDAVNATMIGGALTKTGKTAIKSVTVEALKAGETALKSAGKIVTSVLGKEVWVPESIIPSVRGSVRAVTEKAPALDPKSLDETLYSLLFVDIKDPNELVFRSIKPRIIKGVDLKKIKDNYALANKTLVELGYKPSDLKTYVDAIDNGKRQIWTQIEARMNEAGLDTTVDLLPIALRLLDKSADPALLRVNPRGAKQLVDFAENMIAIGDKINIVEAERIKQMINAQLDDTIFAQVDLTAPLKEGMKDLTHEIGVQLDQVLSIVPGEFAALKHQYGALRSIEDDVIKRFIVFERQNPEGLVDSLTKIQAVGEIAFGSNRERLRGLQRLTVAQIIKERNDANKMIQRAFDLLTE